MAKTELLRRHRRKGGPGHVTGSRSGRPLARRLLGLFRRTRAALVAGLALWCVGLVGVAGAATITEFAIPTPNSRPTDITAGPDGALWFTERDANKIGRITTAGAITEFAIPTAGSSPMGITAGPDGALWFTEFNGSKIGRITTAGAITEFAVPGPTLGSTNVPLDITAGPDGALWFTDLAFSGNFTVNGIGRITTAGTITEFATPTASTLPPAGITAGPDGALWFTELDATKIGRITTGGTVTEFSLPTAGTEPAGITAGPDGALWFTEFERIGRITTGGAITEFPLAPHITPVDITAGPDGALWFTESNKIGRITTAGTITEFSLPTPGSFPFGISVGPDGALWFTEFNGNRIGRIVPDPVWSAAVFLNGSALRTGQTITYRATLFPGITPPNIDIYLGALLPDGVTFLSLVQVAPGVISVMLGPAPVPFLANVTLTPTVVSFSHMFTGTEPVGTYFAYAGLAVAGSNPFLTSNQLSLGVQTFQFNP